ncbi:hypothetical protein V7S43_010407 [Phytophthora oleae]|uniref:Crinkler effector protein N-terminal domain-containing protein n=1 Tax=Phytophthora oleae TaxID=2107226 RepID=A0ABD3FD14_9STRA
MPETAPFSVEIDEVKAVGDLKKAIKDENKDIKCPARKLQPFLAKRDEGRGSWLTEAEVTKGEYATDGLKPLDVAGAPPNLVDLSKKDVRYRVTKEDVTAKRTPVHVMVVVPEGAESNAVPSIEKFGE